MGDETEKGFHREISFPFFVCFFVKSLETETGKRRVLGGVSGRQTGDVGVG